MGKLISPLKIRGTVDDVCYRLTEDGVIVQSKPGPTAEQVRTGKNFDLTRRNASEFGRATKDAMLLRHSLGYVVRAVKHARLSSHMNKVLHRIAKSDKVSEFGSRHADAGNLQLLAGFDYNHLLGVDMALPVPLGHSLDATTGAVQLTVPGCIVRRKKALFPAAATHFKIVSCAGAVDFNRQRFASDIAQSELLPLSKKMPELRLKHSLQAEPGQVMLHTVGIVFYKVEDGEATLLRGGALKIVQVARKEQVVITSGTGTPAHAAILHTCGSDRYVEQADPPATAVIPVHSGTDAQADISVGRRLTRLRGYYLNKRRQTQWLISLLLSFCLLI
jgi:hypothetical protein